MNSFSYRAFNAQGKMSTGEMAAPSMELAARALQKRGLIAVDISQEKTGLLALLSKPLFEGNKLTTKDLLSITRELATLVGAGLTLVKSLTVLTSMNNNKRTSDVILRLLTDIREGDSFQAALSKEKDQFPRFYISMVGAGEASGKLGEVLEKLSDYLERSHDVREKIKSALVYPTVLLVMVVIAMALIITVVLPQFEPIFEQAGENLPWITDVVMSFSRVVNAHGYLMLGMLACTFLGGVAAYRNQTVKAKIHERILSIYIIGNLIKKSEFSRFHRMLGTLSGNGLSLVPAFSIAVEGIGNSHIKQGIKEILVRIKEGAKLSEEYMRAGFVPPLAVELTRVGEDTGRLNKMFLKSADIFEKEVRNLIDKFMALLVPILTIFMGVIIAGMIASVLLGIMSINEIAF